MANEMPTGDEFWEQVRGLVGTTVKNIGNNKTNVVTGVTDSEVTISGRTSPVRRTDVIKSYGDLVRDQSLRRGDRNSWRSISLVLIRAALPNDVAAYGEGPNGIFLKEGGDAATGAGLARRRAWNQRELTLIVTDYFDMLGIELGGEGYNKTAHRNILRPKLSGRSNGSIEFKHCNISTVLRDADLTYIDGYKPRANKQQALVDAVHEFLARHPELSVSATGSLGPDDSHDPLDVPEPRSDDPDKRIWQSIKERRGQPQFRQALLRLYQDKCAVTGHGPKDVLEAAHIQPHSEDGRNSTDNGLLLRADIHTLFDLHLISVDPASLKVVISPQLNGSPYAELRGRKLRQRANNSEPSKGYLAEHHAKVK